MKIAAVKPGLALPGGVVRIEVDGLSKPQSASVEIGDQSAQVIGASRRAVSIRVPEAEGAAIRLHDGNGSSAVGQLTIAHRFPDHFNAVSSPAIDSRGNLYVTNSGARGEKVPFGVFRVSGDGKVEPFLADIVNPTAITVGSDNCLYVSSRHQGVVYRSTLDKRVEKYADNLGIATGLAFDSKGQLIVGDRNGDIIRIAPDRTRSVLCSLEPSVSAYHLLIDPEDNCFITGPTLSTQDSVYKVSPAGNLEVYFRGFGRPQGMAFDSQGNLQVVASYRGRKGVFTIRDGEIEQTVASPMLVGLCYDTGNHRLYLVDNSNLFLFDWSTTAAVS